MLTEGVHGGYFSFNVFLSIFRLSVEKGKGRHQRKDVCHSYACSLVFANGFKHNEVSEYADLAQNSKLSLETRKGTAMQGSFRGCFL